MAKELAHISFDEFAANLPRVFDRIVHEHVAVVVEKASGERAVLKPVDGAPRRRKGRKKTAADFDAFLASAGGWKGLVDTEKLKKDIEESRSLPARPPVVL